MSFHHLLRLWLLSQCVPHHTDGVLPVWRVSQSLSQCHTPEAARSPPLSQLSVFWTLLVIQSKSVFWAVSVSLASDVLGGKMAFVFVLLFATIPSTRKPHSVQLSNLISCWNKRQSPEPVSWIQHFIIISGKFFPHISWVSQSWKLAQCQPLGSYLCFCCLLWSKRASGSLL